MSDPMRSPTFRRLFGKYGPERYEGLLHECEAAYDNPDALRRTNIPEKRIQELMDVVRELRSLRSPRNGIDISTEIRGS